ncbi:MAG: thiamine-phosphate kinase, partial [bacterium]
AISGEFALISKLRERLERGGGERSAASAEVVLASGDDAAITVPRGATATSVDLSVDGVHFRRSTASPRAIGHKAAAAALSDLAAMGATTGELYVQLGLPPDLDEDACLEIADGIADVATAHGAVVLGGDLARAPVLVLAVTVVGHAHSKDALVTRSGARAGDLVCVTGELGGAAAGLALLERPELADAVAPAIAADLRARQLEPQPRLASGGALAGAGARAMIDVSDGLGADAAHLANASAVRIEIEAELIPIAAGVREVAEAFGTDPIELAAGGGEDYELLVALAEAAYDDAAALLAGDAITLTPMGRVAAGEGVALRRRSGPELEIEGFDQLRARPQDPG